MAKLTGRMVKSADTLIIENALRLTAVGEVAEYKQLSAAIGRDVREHCYTNLNSARKSLVSESIFFDVVSGVGLKRLDMSGATKASGVYVKRARSASRRGLKHLQAVKFDELPEADKRTHLTTSAQLGAIDLFSSGKAAKKIEDKTTSGSVLAIGETLKLFGG